MARMAIGVIGGQGFRQRAGVAIASLLALAGCGGGGGGGSPPAPPPPPATFSIGGTVTGLTGTGLVLRNNGGNDLTINANGNFSFSTRLATGAAYTVTVAVRPTGGALPIPFGQTCIVGDGAGNVATINVTTVDVICGPPSAKFLYVTADSPTNVRGFRINALTGALLPITAPPVNTFAMSPGAPVADPDGQFLYFTNAVSNNISVYSIHPDTGALTEIAGSPFAAGGTSPNAIVIRPDGAFAYVLRNNGAVREVGVLQIDLGTGALTPAAVPAVGVAIGAGAPIFDPSGKFLYVSSTTLTGAVYGYSSDATTGALQSVAGSPYLDTRVTSMTFNAAGTKLYGSTVSNGFPPAGSVQAYNVEASGALTVVGGSAANAVAGGPIRLSPDGRFLFVAGTDNVLNSIITSFVVQPTGALAAAPNGTVVLGSGTSVNFAIDPSGKAIAAYPVTGTAATLIAVDQTTGALSGTLLEPFGFSPLAGVLDHSGLFTYVLGGSTVYPYVIDPIGLRADELPPISVGGGISLRQAVLVGRQ